MSARGLSGNPAVYALPKTSIREDGKICAQHRKVSKAQRLPFSFGCLIRSVLAVLSLSARDTCTWPTRMNSAYNFWNKGEEKKGRGGRGKDLRKPVSRNHCWGVPGVVKGDTAPLIDTCVFFFCFFFFVVLILFMSDE